MRSAGCIWNDISDADIDPYVERTANRPIAAKLISKKLGYIYLVIILFLAASIALQLPFNAFILCLLAVGLTLLYPLTKRFYCPTAIPWLRVWNVGPNRICNISTTLEPSMYFIVYFCSVKLFTIPFMLYQTKKMIAP